MSKTIIVHLRVIKGTKVLRNDDGTLANENQIVKLQHGTLEWVNYMENLHRNGFCEAKVEKVIELSKRDEKTNIQAETEIKDFKVIDAEVQAIMKPVSDKKISVADELAQLKKEMIELQKGNVKTEKVVDVVDNSGSDNTDSKDDIKALRVEYKELNPEGKGAFTGWKADVLKEKIAAFKA